jgi:hypothetical protein
MVNITVFTFTGLRSLVYDNITEHPSTINTLARMNVYQEVFLAFIYRNLPLIKVSSSAEIVAKCRQ